MKYLLRLALLLTLSATANAWANTYADKPQAVAMIDNLAERDGYDRDYLYALLLAIGRDDEVLRKISTPAEKTLEWFEYRDIFLDEQRIANGVTFWQDNADALARAEAEFGVDAAIIVAIIGVETRYGKVTGSTPVLQALATLCFDYPKRAKFFCEQFDYMLRLSKAQNFNPLRIKGSYAGAMGMAQFMPSSYLNDAIDYDGDGQVNLWSSPTDAIGSIGNYLANRDWKRGGKFAYRLAQQPQISDFGNSHQPHLATESLRQDKTVKNDENIIKWLASTGEEKLGTLILQGKIEEQWWITHHNFMVITRYNTSPLYAMAVIDLAAELSTLRSEYND